MLKHTVLNPNGKSTQWYEIHTQEDLQQYIAYAKDLAHSEFRASIRMDDRGLTHNNWKSPITKLSIALRGMGKSMMVLFAENESAYFRQITDGLADYGVVFINESGGYNFGIELDPVETQEVDKIEVNLLTITSGTTNLILENDIAIEEELLNYMESNEIPYSSIIQLRLAVTNGDLMRAFSYIMDANDYQKINLYVKTTAIDVEQIWKLLDKVGKYIGEINAMIPESAVNLLDSLEEDYPEIKFKRIEPSYA